jgi:hypothetical protein
MPGLYFHCEQLLGLARDACDRATKAVAETEGAWPGEAVVAVVLAAASAEAFINELTELMAMKTPMLAHRGPSLPPALSAFADALTEIEESRGSTNLKYLMASQTLGGKMFDKGGQPYQDFALLMTLRNDIMHLKPKDVFEEKAREDGTEITVRWPKYIAALQGRGLARTVPKKVIISWFELLKSEKLARWACDAAYRIMLAILDLIPDDGLRDPSADLKHSLRQLWPSA